MFSLFLTTDCEFSLLSNHPETHLKHTLFQQVLVADHFPGISTGQYMTVIVGESPPDSLAEGGLEGGVLNVPTVKDLIGLRNSICLDREWIVVGQSLLNFFFKHIDLVNIVYWTCIHSVRTVSSSSSSSSSPLCSVDIPFLLRQQKWIQRPLWSVSVENGTSYKFTRPPPPRLFASSTDSRSVKRRRKKVPCSPSKPSLLDTNCLLRRRTE